MTQQADNKYFHFTLGPVQGFVAQARRTRDFWAGSFLLSWLAGVAILAVKEQGGEVKFPIPDDNFLSAITGGANIEKLPQQGGIPNRFMANISECQNFDPKAVTQAVQQAWWQVCEAVWQYDKKGLAQNAQTRQIWERQIKHFWDMSWVITEDNDTSALDKRKNLRTHVPSIEDGYKCMMMEGYQELSGTHTGQANRQFWQDLCSLPKMGLDLREGEQLCAIAYVKRRFVRVFDKVAAHIVVADNSIQVHGWKLPANVPSVAYMAATPWLQSLIRSDEFVIDFFQDFNHRVGELSQIEERFGICSERKNHIHSIQQAFSQSSRHLIDLDDISVDGHLYYQSYWDNDNNFYADKQHRYEAIDTARQKAAQALQKLYDKMGDVPSPYYAVLLMDGDSLGKQMGFEKRQPIISTALNDFTQKVQDIVKEQDGFLIYAGGDDVLAIFSLDKAMSAAVSLQACYQQCFAAASTKETTVESTLSGAINYCHIGTSLTHILMDSHDLLDNIAKEGTGRNALAIRVWKPSGMAVQWSLPWDKVLDKASIEQINQQFGLTLDQDTAVIEALAKAMSQQKLQDNSISVFSSGFFYKTRHLMDMLETMMLQQQLEVTQASKLLLAEFLQSAQFGKMDKQQKEHLIKIFEILIDQSRDYKTKLNDGHATCDETSGKKLSGDAGILLRILGQKGLGKGDK